MFSRQITTNIRKHLDIRTNVRSLTKYMLNLQ